jgi:hypothetical protein
MASSVFQELHLAFDDDHLVLAINSIGVSCHGLWPSRIFHSHPIRIPVMVMTPASKYRLSSGVIVDD